MVIIITNYRPQWLKQLIIIIIMILYRWWFFHLIVYLVVFFILNVMRWYLSKFSSSTLSFIELNENDFTVKKNIRWKRNVMIIKKNQSNNSTSLLIWIYIVCSMWCYYYYCCYYYCFHTWRRGAQILPKF